ncbi:hypothetical protein ABH941_003633 [Streptacidiphilus sp. EB103A]
MVPPGPSGDVKILTYAALLGSEVSNDSDELALVTWAPNKESPRA